jgi:hypothetical protein
MFVYYESIKRELKRRLIYFLFEYRCDEKKVAKEEEEKKDMDTRLELNL